MDTVKDNSNSSLFRLIFVNGILLFGVPVALVTAVFRAVTATVPWQEYLFSTPVVLAFFAQAIVSGLVFGIVVWFLKRRASR
jgi:hypothetical protein